MYFPTSVLTKVRGSIIGCMTFTKPQVLHMIPNSSRVPQIPFAGMEGGNQSGPTTIYSGVCQRETSTLEKETTKM